MSNGIKIIDYFSLSKGMYYNKPLISKNRIKKYINKRFGHDLCFKNVKVHSSQFGTEKFYDKSGLRKKQAYDLTTFHYNFTCKKCKINFQAGCGSAFLHFKKINWEFMSDDWDIDIRRYSCNEWTIKKLLE